MADAETGQPLIYRFINNMNPDKDFVASTVASFALGQASYENKKKYIVTGSPILIEEGE